MKKQKQLPKLKGFTYSHDWDFYGYQPFDGRKDCWYIEGRDGSMLIGDGLPRTEAEAKAYCRCANIAHGHAMDVAVEAFKESMGI